MQTTAHREQRSIQGLSGIQRLRMLLYADDIVLLYNDIDELSEIVKIYDKTFARFGLKMSTGKTETMDFNVGGFKYLGHMIVNTDDNKYNFLNFRIASAYQKWNDLKHVVTDRRVKMNTRTKSWRLVYVVAFCIVFKLGSYLRVNSRKFNPSGTIS